MRFDQGFEHFERARLSDLDRAQAYLKETNKNPDANHRLSSLLNDLYHTLRSPVWPKKGYRLLVDQLLEGLQGKPVKLLGMLAGETAEREFPAYVNLINLLQNAGIQSEPHVLTIYWPTTSETRDLLALETLTDQTGDLQQQQFEKQIVSTQSVWKARNLPLQNLHIWPLKFGVREKRTSSLPDVILDPPDEVALAAEELHSIRQKETPKGERFSSAHASLVKLGPQQGELDTVLHRATGIYFNKLIRQHPGPSVWMATELAGSLLDTYGMSKTVPGLNLNVLRR